MKQKLKYMNTKISLKNKGLKKAPVGKITTRKSN